MSEFNNDTLKEFSKNLVDKFEAETFDLFLDIISEGDVLNENYNLLENTFKTQFEKEFKKKTKNKDAVISSTNDVKISMNFVHGILGILQIASKNNYICEEFVGHKKNINTLINQIGKVTLLRNKVSHAYSQNISLNDIRLFLIGAIEYCKPFKFHVLCSELEMINTDIPSAIYDSKYFVPNLNQNFVKNNLPIPEYRNWGFQGREDDILKIISALRSGHDRIIAITGAGGIGKSALALKIGHELSSDLNNIYFNQIVWVSSKSNYLTAEGIKDISGGEYQYADDYREFLNQLISGIHGQRFLDDVDNVSASELESLAKEELFNDGYRKLVIIDNLENIDDNRIKSFIKNNFHGMIQCLITSRIGMSDINKIIPLKGLDENASFKLFKKLCEYYNLGLEGIDDITIKSWLNNAQHYPLVIKWCLSLVKNGKEFSAAFEELEKYGNDLVRFSFEQVYKKLKTNSKRILQFTCRYDDLPERYLIQFMSKITDNDFEEGIVELLRFSLITVEHETIDKNRSIEIIKPLPLVEVFVEQVIIGSSSVRDRIDKEIKSVEELLQKTKPSDTNTPSGYLLTQSDRIAQSILLEAFKSVSENKLVSYKNITLQINKCKSLAPGYYKTHFYESLIESTKQEYDRRKCITLIDNSIKMGNIPNTLLDIEVLTEQTRLLLLEKPFDKRIYEYSILILKGNINHEMSGESLLEKLLKDVLKTDESNSKSKKLINIINELFSEDELTKHQINCLITSKFYIWIANQISIHIADNKDISETHSNLLLNLKEHLQNSNRKEKNFIEYTSNICESWKIIKSKNLLPDSKKIEIFNLIDTQLLEKYAKQRFEVSMLELSGLYLKCLINQRKDSIEIFKNFLNSRKISKEFKRKMESKVL